MAGIGSLPARYADHRHRARLRPVAHLRRSPSLGLHLQVGILADLARHDPEGAEDVRSDFEQLNGFLESRGRPLHQEPTTCDPWSAEMFGYSGLHTLRRVAAHLDSGADLPPPGDSSAADDPRLEAYFRDATEERPMLLARLGGATRRMRFERSFDHLILHSDAEGFYLPVELDEVLFPPDRYKIPGGMVGSSQRLLDECQRLRAALRIPDDLTTESEALWSAADGEGDPSELWQRYGVESFTCVALLEGCRRSVSTGSALVFC